MYFYKKLYTDETTYKKRGRICRNLKTGRGQLSVYVISVAKGKELFDIFHAATLKQKGYPKDELIILGIASSYDSAVAIGARMFEDLYQKYGLTFKETFLREEQDMFRR